MTERTRLAPEQILSIHERRNSGDSYDKIAADMGIRKLLAYNVHKHFLKYIEHPRLIGRKNRRFTTAKALLNKKYPVKIIETTPQLPLISDDPFEMLSQAESTFHEALTTFIEAMVEKRCGELKRENEELKNIREVAKMTNWSNSLKRRFQ